MAQISMEIIRPPGSVLGGNQQSNPFEIVVRIISDKPSDEKKAGASLEVRRQMKDRAKRLQSFVKLARNLAQEFENQLAALPPAADPEDEF